MKLKFKFEKQNLLTIVVVIQFILLSIGGYFIYENHQKNLVQSKNINVLSSNAKIIKENTNNKVENVEIALNEEIDNLTDSLVKETTELDDEISELNSSLTRKINSIPEGPPGPQGARGPRGAQGPAGTLNNSDRALLNEVKDALGGSSIFGGTQWNDYFHRDLVEIDECLDAINEYITGLSSFFGSRLVGISCSN